MARGAKPGGRHGGRVKGTPNKQTIEVQARLAALGCDPIEGMAKIALGLVPCPECLAKGKQKYSAGIAGMYVDVDHGKLATCHKCHGSKREPVPLKISSAMFAELAQYVTPKRKAIELTGEVKLPPALMVTIEGGDASQAAS